MNEYYDKYTADASKQSGFKAIKKKEKTAKDNADKLKNKIKNTNLEFAYLKKL